MNYAELTGQNFHQHFARAFRQFHLFFTSLLPTRFNYVISRHNP